jgi:hypothetical protein
MVLGVADVRCDLEREGGGGTPKRAPKPVAVRAGFGRGVFAATLSDPEDLDMTSFSFEVEETRADFDLLTLALAGAAVLVPSSPDCFRVGLVFDAAAAPAAPQNPHDAPLLLRTTFARSFLEDEGEVFTSGSGGGVGSFPATTSTSIMSRTSTISRSGSAAGGGDGGGGGASSSMASTICLVFLDFLVFFSTTTGTGGGSGSAGGGGGGGGGAKLASSIR